MCDGQPSNCGLLAVAVLDCYDINGGGPGIIEYVTSFGKRMDLHGLWNAQGVASNLHCEPTEILDFLEGKGSLVGSERQPSPPPFLSVFFLWYLDAQQRIFCLYSTIRGAYRGLCSKFDLAI